LPHLPPSLPSWKNYGKPFCDKRQLAYIYGSDKAVAKHIDSGATLLGVNKNGTEIKLHSNRPGSTYDLAKFIAENSGQRVAFADE